MAVYFRNISNVFIDVAGKYFSDIKQIKNFSTNSRSQNAVSLGKLLGLIAIVTAGYSLTRCAITWYYSGSKTNSKPEDKGSEDTEPKPGPRATNDKPEGTGSEVKDRTSGKKGSEARSLFPNSGSDDDFGKEAGDSTPTITKSKEDKKDKAENSTAPDGTLPDSSTGFDASAFMFTAPLPPRRVGGFSPPNASETIPLTSQIPVGTPQSRSEGSDLEKSKQRTSRNFDSGSVSPASIGVDPRMLQLSGRNFDSDSTRSNTTTPTKLEDKKEKKT